MFAALLGNKNIPEDFKATEAGKLHLELDCILSFKAFGAEIMEYSFHYNAEALQATKSKTPFVWASIYQKN